MQSSLKWIFALLVMLPLAASISVGQEGGDVGSDQNQPGVELDTTIVAMIDDGIVADRAGGLGIEPEQWRRYVRFRDLVESEIDFLDHESPIVRCYAFRLMTERSHPDLFPALLGLLRDTSYVLWQMGCTRMAARVGDYALSAIQLSSASIEESDLRIVDSVVLFVPGLRLRHRTWLLDTLEPTPETYARVRDLVTAERESAALLPLARHRRSQDRKLILDALNSSDPHIVNDALDAVAAYPDPIFYDALISIFSTARECRLEGYDVFRAVCGALAHFPRRRTAQLFEEALHERDGFRIPDIVQAIRSAVGEMPKPVYRNVDRELDRLEQFFPRNRLFGF